MQIQYQTKGVCARRIFLEVENGIVRHVRFEGGCDGNAQGIARLVEGMDAKDAMCRLSGLRCNGKPSSCPDQLAKAIASAL